MMSMMSNSAVERTLPVDSMRIHVECMDIAGRNVEKQIIADGTFPPLMARMQISSQGNPSVSGRTEYDYNKLNGAGTPPGLSNIKQLSTITKAPLPPEIIESFKHMQCHWMMGLFTEIDRAWVSIDSDIYLWTYEGVSDVAFFEGMSETILSVGLVKPKPGVFHNFVEYLLILTSTVEIVILGLTFTNTTTGPMGPKEVITLLPDPVFAIPTDGNTINTIACSSMGRIFLGARDGSLLEINYQAKSGWFGQRYQKKNHSTSNFSFLVPSFLNIAFGEDDPIILITLDESRHILYSLSEKGTITVYDMGNDGNGMCKVVSMSQSAVVQTAVRISSALDSNMFRPLKTISAIEKNESPQLNLVAVTETGVRLYFTASSVEKPYDRPYTLVLMHVRLPPGYAGGDPPTQRPVNVLKAHYRRGTLVMATSPSPNCHLLWCMSSDSYPFYQYLFEEQTAVPLPGTVLSLCEVKPTHSALPCSKYSEQELTPLAVRQHYEAPTKYIALTSQGAEILIKLRPVDLLRQILQDNHGPECEAVKIYFAMQKEEQACAMSLVIACNESVQNVQLAEWATRAFFHYGGEPHLVLAAPTANQVTTPINSPSYSMAFNPNVVSTPYGGNQQAMSSTIDHRSQVVQYSAKHNGMYLFLSRILRPVWNLHLVYTSETDNKVKFLASCVTRDDCVQILSHLHALRSFLEKNTQFSTVATLGRTFHNTSNVNTNVEAHLEEKKSLDALKYFVSRACEVLGLWRILCEHQFHILVDRLDRDMKNQLQMMTFRHMILSGSELCSTLIQILINLYLSDNAPVDTISSKMREICPNLYRNEDAACSKANEMLLLAGKTQNQEERNNYLQSALAMCKDVAPKINLPVISQLFFASQFYEGVLDLSVTCAKRLDPKDVALHYYSKDEPPEDQEGFQFYNRRMECYKEVTNVLNHLFGESQSSPYTSSVLMAPGGPTQSTNIPVVDTGAAARRLFALSLDSNDEMLHIALYDWMMSRHLYTDLISINKISLAAYLKKAAKLDPNNNEMHDLLWKYYEKNSDHASAAKILYKLAINNKNVDLSQRVDYLARAVMCMRSEKIGAAQHLGVFLRELEDFLTVARLQQKVLEAITKLRGQPGIEDAIRELNLGVLEITQLYESYAEPYNLWACKLAIIHCSGHNDLALVENIWLNLIEAEVRECSATDPNAKMQVLLSQVKTLGRDYMMTPRCFPLAFLVRFLEIQSCRLQAELKHVFMAMYELEVPSNKLMEVYEKLVSATDRCWADEGDEFHLVLVIVELIDSFIHTAYLLNSKDRRTTAASAADALLSCLKALYSKPGTAELVTKVKTLQSKLDRMTT